MRLLPFALLPGIAASGFRRLFGPSRVAVLAATFFFVVNPFMYERMLAGHAYFVLGAAFLPLLLSYLLETPSLRSVVKAGLLMAVLFALSLHFVFITGVMLLAVITVGLARKHPGLSVSAAASGACAGALSLYWLVPFVFAPAGPRHLSTAHLRAFRTQADAHLGLVPNVAGLYGFWRTEWPLSKSQLPSWPLILAAILVVVLVGFSDLVRRPADRSMTLSLAGAGGVGLVLSLGNQGPTGAIFVWLFEHVPGFATMREPQKFLSLLVLAYAALFGWGVKVLSEQATTRNGTRVVALLLLLLPTAYSFRELFGFLDYARPSRYPASWAAADRLMGTGQGKVWALPWHEYLHVPWAQDRVLANPMQSFFRRDVVVSNDPEVSGITGVGQSDLQNYLDFLLHQSDRSKHVGRLIAPLGIRYVALAKVADYKSYAWLDHQDELRVVRRWGDLVLYENEAASHGGGYVPGGRVTLHDWGKVIGAARAGPFTDLAVDVRHAGPGTVRPVRVPDAGPGEPVRIERKTPISYRVLGTADRGPLVTFLTPAEGWQYEGAHARANLGVAAMFSVGKVGRGTIQYGPWKVVRLGYLLGTIMLGSAIFLLVWRPTGKTRTRLRS